MIATIRRTVAAWACIALSGFLGGCGSSKSDGDATNAWFDIPIPGDLQGGDGGPQVPGVPVGSQPPTPGTGAAEATEIGAAGGSITLEGATLTIPAGALREPVQVSITSSLRPTPSGMYAYSPIYAFEPAGTKFTRPVAVSFQFEGDPERSTVYWSNDGDIWERLGGIVDGATITVHVTHFSEGFAANGFEGQCLGPARSSCPRANGICEPFAGEYCLVCPNDCGACLNPEGTCPDGTCQPPWEDKRLCPEDCGGCEWCGDGTCAEGREDALDCPEDCTNWRCGDGVCDEESESEEDCPGDCRDEGFCGDCVCEPDEGENFASCSMDCANGRIGDEKCSPDENAWVSPADCRGTHKMVCGDGFCHPDETRVCPGCPEQPDPCPPGWRSPDDCGSGPVRAGGESWDDFIERYHDWACTPDFKNTPDCGRDTLGRFTCSRVEISHELLLSNYKVDGIGVGQHQGMAIRRTETWYDERSGTLCARGAGGAGPIIKQFFNHGRTVSTHKYENALGEIKTPFMVIETFRTSLPGRYYQDYGGFRPPSWDPEGVEAIRQLLSAEQCFDAIEDGFCDSVCGNDGYSLPDALVLTRPRACDDPNAMELTPKEAHLDANRPAGAEPACARFPGTVSRLMPRFGHNSNNDANAERAFFLSCSTELDEDGNARTRSDWQALLGPEICATHCDSTIPEPGCWSDRNIATFKVDWCRGCMRLPSWLDGDSPSRDAYAGCWWLDESLGCQTTQGECPFIPGKLVGGLGGVAPPEGGAGDDICEPQRRF